MNAAIKQQIGRPKADVGDPTSSRRKLPKEAFKFAKQMGIDMSGVEPEVIATYIAIDFTRLLQLDAPLFHLFRPKTFGVCSTICPRKIRSDTKVS